LSLREGAVLLMGANVGTTATAHLLAMGGIPPWPLAVSGALLWWRSRRPVVRGIAQALLGTGLLLAGLDALGTGLAPLGAAPRFDGALAVVRGEPWLGFAAGAALTAAAFSSTAAVGVLQSLAVQGILTVPDALPFLWGLNVGTTADALAVGWWLGGPALSAAFFHAAFNLVGAAAFMPLNGLLAAVLARCVPDPAAQLAWAHTVQNAGTALLCLPALEPLVRLCDGLANLRPGRRRA
ncbi:MAG: Na/Pi cotransporter family protein, partial [Clostridia bacterium]|nr:Na/Pi cotransporter family protein [Clostridia bacterium]